MVYSAIPGILSGLKSWQQPANARSWTWVQCTNLVTLSCTWQSKMKIYFKLDSNSRATYMYNSNDTVMKVTLQYLQIYWRLEPQVWSLNQAPGQKQHLTRKRKQTFSDILAVKCSEVNLIVKLKKKTESSCFKGDAHDFERSMVNILLHIYKKL